MQIFPPAEQKLYDLTDDAFLTEQNHFESEVRAYPRGIPLALASGDGAMLTDTRGQTYLDCHAAAGALALGHNHPEIKQTIHEQLDRAVPFQTLDLTTPTKNHFVRTLFGYLPPTFAERKRIQFCGPTGADAVEASIKLAKIATGRDSIIAFHGGYHGMTHGALSLTGNLKAKSRRHGLMPDVHFFPFPYTFRCPFGLAGEASASASTRFLERALYDSASGITKPAAILVEPVQGEGGVIPAPNEWLRELRRITSELDILLIFDEVQCGISRTGTHFAFEAADVAPDILILSKAVGGGFPLSILLFDEAIDVWHPGEHSGTFRGNQFAMATGAKTLEIIVRDNLTGNAQQMGERLRAGIASLQADHPCIGDVRGRGLMIGVEIVEPDKWNPVGQPLASPALASALQRGLLQRGLIAERGGRENCILRITPPLIINEAEVDFAVDAFRKTLSGLAE